MFIVNQNGKNITIKPFQSFEMGEPAQIQILENVKQLTVIGKSSVFDNNYNHLTNCSSITFHGEKFFDFPESSQVELYRMGNLGFLFHDKKVNLVYASRSLSLLNDFCAAFGSSIISLMQSVNRTLQVHPFHLDMDFITKNEDLEEINPEIHTSFEFGWNGNSYNHFSFEMIVESSKHEIFKGMFYTKYSGRAVNIGDYEQYIVIDDPDKTYPEFFPERELNYNVIFTNLKNDNAADVLAPNIMLREEYKQMIQQAKNNGQTNLVYSGLSRSGYGVQAFIDLISEDLCTPTYEAIVTKLVVCPYPNIESTFLFKEKTPS